MRKYKSFELGGIKFKIKYTRKLNENGGAWGYCDYDKGQIEICDPRDCNEDLFRITFNHELIHAILFAAGQTELSKNEPFVELVAQLSAQVMKTLK
jgi:predicted SprT family Zn-dependent metalloprotease